MSIRVDPWLFRFLFAPSLNWPGLKPHPFHLLSSVDEDRGGLRDFLAKSLDKGAHLLEKLSASGMRLPLLIALVIVGGIAWLSWPRAKPPEPVIAAAAQPTPVPFLVKAKVKAIMAEQRRIFAGGSRADIEAAQTKIRIFAEDIRERLASDGIYDQGAVQGVIRAAAAEAGLDPQQAASASAGVSAPSRGKPSGPGGVVRGALHTVSEIADRPAAE